MSDWLVWTLPFVPPNRIICDAAVSKSMAAPIRAEGTFGVFGAESWTNSTQFVPVQVQVSFQNWLPFEPPNSTSWCVAESYAIEAS